MRQHIYVISDLHLGGAPAAEGRRGFQICPPATQQVLAAFIDRLPGRSEDADCRLVINGDIVDFLAEAPFQAFVADPDEAVRKFRDIVANTAPVWAALRRFVGERDGALTLMLGNHDIELSLPATRQALLEAVGPGRVEFIYDNEAFVAGPLLVEHGNRFDAWNAVRHGELRRVRSQLSRRRTAAPDFPAVPGSRLVVDVLNPLKADYPFIDLLKPEGAAALPVAAALGATGLRDAWEFFGNYRRTKDVDYDDDQEPVDADYIAARTDEDRAMYRAARDIAAGGDAEKVGFVGNLLAGAREAIDEEKRRLRRAALYQAFRVTAGKHRAAFDVDVEADKAYLTAAQRAASSGFQVIVYGHTHLAKRMALKDPDALYLNSGTWADLMRVPAAVWSWDEASSRQELEAFVDDLEHSRLDRWRRPVPTYVRVELDGERVAAAELRFGDDDAEVTTQALKDRLAGGA